MSEIDRSASNDRREADCINGIEEEPGHITVDDLCNQRLTSVVLNAVKEVQFSIGVDVSGGNIGMRASARLPLKPLLLIVALILAGKYVHFYSLLKSISASL